jgi:hypothetical protein
MGCLHPFNERWLNIFTIFKVDDALAVFQKYNPKKYKCNSKLIIFEDILFLEDIKDIIILKLYFFLIKLLLICIYYYQQASEINFSKNFNFYYVIVQK